MDNIEHKSSNNSAKDKANQEIVVEQSKQNSNKQKKSKARMYIVLLFILLVAIVGYIIYRGEYLEILEIGENYLSIFWQNVNYTAIAFIINFIFLFCVIYINNTRIKNALKPFFDTEKKQMPKLPNKSISLILSVIVSAITTEVIINQYMLFTNSTWFGRNDPGFRLGYWIFYVPKAFYRNIIYVRNLFNNRTYNLHNHLLYSSV